MSTVYPSALRQLSGSSRATLAALLLSASAALPANSGVADGPGAADRSVEATESAARSAERRASQGTSRDEQIRSLIERAARRHGVEVALVHAVVAAESAYNVDAVSPAGAVGLMQLLPATALDYGVGSRAALFDPSINVDTGVRHLKRLLRKYRGDYGRVIMAYNAGEGIVDRTNSNVRFAETLDYTEAVVRRYRQLGGTRPTAAVLRKVSALRRRPGSESPANESTRQPDAFGLLPTTSARLQARLPSALADERSSSADPRDESRFARGQSRSPPGSGLRSGVDPAIRDAARAAPDRRPALPVTR
jgi:soluble lytic murein transglycosylase-like protein